MTVKPTSRADAEPHGPAMERAHIPALDGLRGLAILAVLVFHFTGGHPIVFTKLDLWASRFTELGWCGVDLFFVLSGFLITGILYDTKNSPGFLRNFYARRVLRIFPLYYGVLLLAFVVLPNFQSFYLPGIQVLSKYQVWLWTYSSNIGALVEGDVFHSGLIQMDHFWSLAVEEQFYLIWPLVVLWLERATLLRVCIGCIAAGLVMRTGMVICEVPSIYTLTPCRLDGLMAGSWIALTLRSGVSTSSLAPWARRVGLACACALLPIWLAFGLNGSHWATQTVGFTLLSGVFGSLLILMLAAPSTGWWARTVSSPTLRFLGRYSYGIYVWHYLLMQTFSKYFSVTILVDEVFGHYWPARITYVLLSSAASVFIAWMSWHLFERHFVALKRYFAPGDRRVVAVHERRAARTTSSLAPALGGGQP